MYGRTTSPLAPLGHGFGGGDGSAKPVEVDVLVKVVTLTDEDRLLEGLVDNVADGVVLKTVELTADPESFLIATF